MKQIYKFFLFSTFIVGCILSMNAPLNGMAPQGMPQGNPKPTASTFNEMLEKMQKTTPTTSVLSTISNDLQLAQKDIPPQCQKELNIAFEDFAAKAQLADITLTTMKKNGAKVAGMRKLFPTQMTQIAQNTFGPKLVQAEGEMAPSERPVVSVAQTTPEASSGRPQWRPVEPIKSIKETLTKPVEIPAIQEKPVSQPKQPKTSYLFGPPPTKMIPGFAQQVGFQATPIQKGPSPIKGRPSQQVEGPEPTGTKRGIHEPEEISETGAPEAEFVAPEVEANELIRKALEEFMNREYPSEDYAEALKLQDQKKLPPLSLTTLHMHIYHAAANQKTMDALKPLFDKCLGYSKNLVNLFAREKPNTLEPDVQRLLDQAFAYILVCFDALARASENGLPGVLTGWFGGESPAVKKERVAHMLKLFSDPILRMIDSLYKNFSRYFAPDLKKEFDANMFDVTKITDNTLVKKVYRYGYGNVGSFHKKEYKEVIDGLYRAAGAAELEQEPIVFELPTMQDCWVALQKIVTSLEQIVDDRENWSIDANAKKDATEQATVMFVEALDARSCLQVPGQEIDVETIVAATYEKAVSLIDMILGEKERKSMENDYADALIVAEDVEKVIEQEEDIGPQASVEDLQTRINELIDLSGRLEEISFFIGPDRFKTLTEDLEITLKQFDKALADKLKAEQKAEQAKPTPVQQPVVVPIPLKPPAKVEPKIVVPATVEPEKKAERVEKFVPLVPLETIKEVEEELPQPSVIVPETLQGPTAQEQIRKSLMAISRDIQSATSISETQTSEWLGLLLAIDQAPEVDENNRALASQARDLLRQKIKAQEAEKQLNAFIAVLEKATQVVNAATTIEENQMIAEEILNTSLAQYTAAKNLVPEKAYVDFKARLTKALEDYCAALVPKVLLDATVSEDFPLTIRTLHTTAFSKPQDIDEWGMVPITILGTDAAKLLLRTLNRIQDANIVIELDELDIVLAALCASFDAWMAALYNSKNVASIMTPNVPAGEQNLSGVPAYLALLHKAAGTFVYIDTFMTQYGNKHCTDSVRSAYNVDNFDITSKLAELKVAPEAEQPEPEQAAKYIYAVAKDTEVNFGAFSVKVEKPISPEHKKDYANIPTQWEKRVSAHQTFADLTKKMEGPQPNTKELTEYLVELGNLKDFIDPTELENLTKLLKTNLTALEKARVELDALFAAFIQKIEDATGLLEDKKITVVNFNAPYIEAKRLIAQYKEQLAATYNPKLDNLVSIYKKYITDAVYTMIDATGLDTLHQRIFNKSAQVEAARTFSLNLDMNRALVDMLNQLKQNALFGVDSTVDYDKGKQSESHLLQKALFAGYAYILVAYDAAEASLYDDFSTVAKITQWLQYLVGSDYATLSSTAFRVIDLVFGSLEKARRIYFSELIVPFFKEGTDTTNYELAYEHGSFNVVRFGIDGITNDDGSYKYARTKAPEIYKGEAMVLLEQITGNHIRHKSMIQEKGSGIDNYGYIPSEWKQIITSIYRPELLERKQQETEGIIQNTLLNLPINGKTLSSMHSKNIVFAMLQNTEGQDDYSIFLTDLSLNGLKNNVLLDNLEELDKADMISDDIRDQLTKAFACICANFDACIFWAYGAAKDKKANRELLGNAFKMIVPLIVDVIHFCWTNYGKYFNDNGKKFDKRGFEIGTLAGAMVQDQDDFNQLKYRYLIATRLTLFTPQSPVNIILNGVSLNVFIDENHKKNYDSIIGRWVKALNPEPLQKPQSASATVSKFLQKTSLPTTEQSQSVEPEAETTPEIKPSLSESTPPSPSSVALPFGITIQTPAQYSKTFFKTLYGQSTAPIPVTSAVETKPEAEPSSSQPIIEKQKAVSIYGPEPKKETEIQSAALPSWIPLKSKPLIQSTKFVPTKTKPSEE